MKRLPAIVTLVISLFAAAYLAWSLPEDPALHEVRGRVGEQIALESGLLVMVTDVGVTRHLTGVVERDSEQLYLVVDVDVIVIADASGQMSLLVSSGDSTFLPGSHRLSLPRYTNPGFVTHCRVPVAISEDDLLGAAVEITATDLLIVGFHRVAHIDLNLTKGRVAELMAQADTPIDIGSAQVEVIQ